MYKRQVLADEIKDLQNKQSDNSEKIDEAKQQKQQVLSLIHIY